MIHDTCDYCFREFGYLPGGKVICMNCGQENARVAARVETATVAPGGEFAVRPEYKLNRKIRGHK